MKKSRGKWEEETGFIAEAVLFVIDRAMVVAVYAVNREEEYTKPGYEEYVPALVEEMKPFVFTLH